MTDNTTDLLPMIIEGIQDRKGKHITVVDLSDIESAAASRFVICEGTSSQHVAAVADSVRDYLLSTAASNHTTMTDIPTLNGLS